MEHSTSKQHPLLPNPTHFHPTLHPQSTNNNTFFVAHDLRYRIHAFGIAHRTLYIFAAGALFSAPLGHPPFNASFGQFAFQVAEYVIYPAEK